MKFTTITHCVASFTLVICFLLFSHHAFATEGTGVVSVTSTDGSCLGFTAAVGNGPDNWEVAEGGSYTMTISGVTECTGDAITVFVQGTNGNFCFNATGGGGTYSGTFTVPNPACFTMPISYKCGGDQPCNNEGTFNADGPSGTGAVHLRAATFDGSCTKTGDDTTCTSSCVCEPPTNITFTTLANDQVQVCWDPQPCATGYILQYQWRGHEDWLTIDVTAPETCAIINLFGHVFISVHVATVCQDGSTTDYSQTVTYTFDGPCTVPTDQSATEISSSTAKLNWTPGTTTNSQRLRYQVLNSNQPHVVGLSAGIGTFTLTNLLPSTTYSWRVKGDCWSTTQKFTTAAQKYYSTADLSNMSVYPNPATDHLFVTLNAGANNHDAVVQIVNSMGQIVSTQNVVLNDGSDVEISFDKGIANGFYIVRVITNDKTFERSVIINNDK